MKPRAVRAYLKELGEREAEIRKPLSDPKSTVDQRTKVLGLLNDMLIFLRGFFAHIRVEHGEQVAKELENYYDQARSKKGLKP